MLPGLMPVPAILAIGAIGGVTGTPIGLLLALTKEIPATGGSVTGTPIGLLLSLTKEIPGTGGGGGGGVTTGMPMGLLLALTKETSVGYTSGEFVDDDGETSFFDDDGATEFIDDAG